MTTSAPTPTRLGALALAALRHPAFVPVCVLLHITLRVLVITLLPAEPSSDAEWYYFRAIDIAEGNGYIKPSGEPTAYWPVGYPAFLGGLFAVFGNDLLVVKLANLALSLVVLWALYSFASRTVGKTAARLAILGYAVYPNAIGYMTVAWTETLYTALLMLGCRGYAFAERPRHYILAGIWFGLGALVRAQNVLIPPLLLLGAFMLHPKQRFQLKTVRNGVLFGLGLAMTILPWTARNYSVFNELVLINTNGGMHFLVSNNPSLQPDYHKNLSADHPWIAETGHPDAPEMESNRKARKLATDFLRENPDYFVKMIPHKLFRMWVPDGESEWVFQANEEFYQPNKTAFRTVRYLNQGYYFATILLALASLFLARRLRPQISSVWPFAIGWCVILYSSLIAAVFSGQPRYHAPLMPFLFLYAAISILVILRVPSELDDTDAPAGGPGEGGNAADDDRPQIA